MARGKTTLRVLIVDDEALARQRVEDLLRHQENVEIVGFADNGEAAITAIRTLQPDLVFLDVQMPGATGLDVIRTIGPADMPATVFVTAYDQYALKAFDLAAIDYLVKPFDDERFEQAFARARRLIELEEVDRLSEQLLAVLQGGGHGPSASAAGGPPSVRLASAASSNTSSASPSRRVVRCVSYRSVTSSTSPRAAPMRSCTPTAARTSFANACRCWKNGWIRRGSSAFTAPPSSGWIRSRLCCGIRVGTTA